MKTRRKTKAPTTSYSLMDELMASTTQPLPEAKQRSYLGVVRKAYAALAEGGPSFAAADLCIDIVGMVESLIVMGVAEDGSGLIDDAQVAIGYAVRMYPDGPAQPLTAEGAHAVKAVIDDYAEIMAAVPARTMIRCHRNAEKQRRSMVSTWRKSK